MKEAGLLTPQRARLVVIARATIATVVPLAAVIVALGAQLRGPLDRGDVGGTVAGMIVAMAAYGLVGAIVTIRRPEERIGWLFVLAGSSSLFGMAAQTALSAGAAPQDLVSGWLLPILANMWILSFVSLALLLVLFPDGRLPSRRWRPLVAVAFLVAVVGLLTSGEQVRPPLVPLLFGEELGETIIGLGQAISGFGSVVLIAAAATALFVRFRRSRGIERQQLKWIAYAGSLLGLAAVATTVVFFSPLRALDPDAPYAPMLFGGIPFITGLVAVPVAAGVAILRYRLYDIDVLINRTLVYGALTASLGAAYVGSVLLLQTVMRPFTAGSDIAVAISTLGVVALFQPLRRRIQGAVDRRFYRSRYDAQRTLDTFAARLRDDVDLDGVREQLLAAVHGTVQPRGASVWLRGDPAP